MSRLIMGPEIVSLLSRNKCKGLGTDDYTKQTPCRYTQSDWVMMNDKDCPCTDIGDLLDEALDHGAGDGITVIKKQT